MPSKDLARSFGVRVVLNNYGTGMVGRWIDTVGLETAIDRCQQLFIGCQYKRFAWRADGEFQQRVDQLLSSSQLSTGYGRG